MLFELHSHSWYSKDRFGSSGFCSPVELVKTAMNKGLDGIAVTDHDSLRSWDTLKSLKLNDFLILSGEEISTRQGHLIALGINEEIRPGMNFLETIDKIHSQGGISVAPHPFDLHEVGLGERAQHADAIEVFNSMNRDHFSNVRAKIFAKYQGKSMVAGSDAHANYMVGRGLTNVRAEFNMEAAIKAIKNGRTSTFENYHPLSELSNWYTDRLSSSPDILQEHMIHNHNLFNHNLLRTIMSHKCRGGVISNTIANHLPYFATAGSAAKSFLVNGPECLM